MNIGIVGLGLIGGSIARRLTKIDDYNVFGADSNFETVKYALEQNIINLELNQENIKDIDILIICLNPVLVLEVLPTYIENLKSDTIVFDIAGNKTAICTQFEIWQKQFPHLHFFSTHPMAGREVFGIENSTDTLFEDKSILLIPQSKNNSKKQIVIDLYNDLGTREVKITDAKTHDAIIAYTSQLAHIISSGFVDSPLSSSSDGFNGGSFSDLSRVAKMNPFMWTELVLENRENVITCLDFFINNMINFKDAISKNDSEKLLRLFQKGNSKKSVID